MHYSGNYLEELRKISQTNVTSFWVHIWTRDLPSRKEESCRCGLPAVSVHYVDARCNHEVYIMSLCYRLISKVPNVRCFVLRADSVTDDTVLSYRCDLGQIGEGVWWGGGRTSDCSQFLVYCV